MSKYSFELKKQVVEKYQSSKDVARHFGIPAYSAIDKWILKYKEPAISELFDVQRPAIYKHISNIFTEEELDEKLVCSILEYTALDNKKYKTKYYNLDMLFLLAIELIQRKQLGLDNGQIK